MKKCPPPAPPREQRFLENQNKWGPPPPPQVIWFPPPWEPITPFMGRTRLFLGGKPTPGNPARPPLIPDFFSLGGLFFPLTPGGPVFPPLRTFWAEKKNVEEIPAFWGGQFQIWPPPPPLPAESLPPKRFPTPPTPFPFPPQTCPRTAPHGPPPHRFGGGPLESLFSQPPCPE